MEVRKAVPKDIAAISRIHAQSWKGGYQNIVPQPYLDALREDFWVDAFTQWIENHTLEALLLLEDGEAVGCVSYGASRDQSLPDWGEIVSLYLLPEHFRKGYGTALMEQALSNLRAEGFRSVYLWVMEENERGRRFYEASGFQASPDRPSFEIAGKTLYEIRYTKLLEG